MGDLLSPVDLGDGRIATAVAAGERHSCALFDGGDVKCWGFNVDGRLGQGDFANRGDDADEMGDALAPVDLGAGRTATAITAGTLHTCLARRGRRQVLGRQLLRSTGQGDMVDRGGDASEMGDFLAPVDLGCRAHRHRDHRRSSHSCAVLDDGTVKCWGDNPDGRLGYGDTMR